VFVCFLTFIFVTNFSIFESRRSYFSQGPHPRTPNPGFNPGFGVPGLDPGSWDPDPSP
jgi:hypothetical protein